MSSLSSSSSSPSHSPLYCPLAEQCWPQGKGDLHSVFYTPPTTSTAGDATPSTSTGGSSPRAEETTAKVASTAKRKLEESASTEQPRKKQRKERHIESPCTSSAKRKRSSSESFESAGEGSSKIQATVSSPKRKKGKDVPFWQWAARYNSVSYRPDKMRLNKLFLKQLHKELLLAQSALQEHDLEVAQLWKEVVPQVPPSREPIVLFKRTGGAQSRLNWQKLAYALSFLGRVEHGMFTPIERSRIQATYIWMHSFLKQLYPSLKTPRILMKPATFTFLCGQALTAQDVWISPLEPEEPSWRQSHQCFLSNEDVARALENEQVLAQESAVCFCQHHDGPRPERSKGSRLCARFPIVDFESDSSSSTEEPQS